MAIAHDDKLLNDAKLAGLFISPILNFDLENEKGEEVEIAIVRFSTIDLSTGKVTYFDKEE